MSSQHQPTSTGQPSLSEKALRLLAAHDREVSQLRGDTRAEDVRATYQMAS